MREFEITQEQLVQILSKARPNEDIFAILRQLEQIDEDEIRANRLALGVEAFENDRRFRAEQAAAERAERAEREAEREAARRVEEAARERQRILTK